MLYVFSRICVLVIMKLYQHSRLKLYIYFINKIAQLESVMYDKKLTKNRRTMQYILYLVLIINVTV